MRPWTLVLIGLPGSPKVAGESLDVVLNLLPHAVDPLQGRTLIAAADSSSGPVLLRFGPKRAPLRNILRQFARAFEINDLRKSRLERYPHRG